MLFNVCVTCLLTQHCVSASCLFDHLVKKKNKTIQKASAGLMLVLGLRRWPNLKPTLSQCIVVAGLALAGEIPLSLFTNLSYEYNLIIYVYNITLLITVR